MNRCTIPANGCAAPLARLGAARPEHSTARSREMRGISEAARVFNEIQSAKDNAMPDAVLNKANGIIIVPAP